MSNSGESGSVSAGAERCNPSRVLVVDDEGLVRWSIAEALNQIGMQAQTACSVADARVRFIASTFDLVITDLQMPGESGFSLVREVKSRLPRCRIIMISAYGDDDTRGWARAMGVADFVDKPVNLDHLLTLSIRLLHEAASPELPN